jgi:hypothetical protein
MDAARDATGTDAAPDDAASADAAGTDAAGTDAAGTDAAPTDGGAACGPSSPPDCFAQCSPGDSCVYAQSDCCCGCEMGAAPVAIRSDLLDEWETRRAMMCGAVDCSDVGCIALFMCPDSPPSCIDGRCVGGSTL